MQKETQRVSSVDEATDAFSSLSSTSLSRKSSESLREFLIKLESPGLKDSRDPQTLHGELISSIVSQLSKNPEHRFEVHTDTNKIGIPSELCPSVELLADPETPLGRTIAGIKKEFPELTVLISAPLCLDHDNCCLYLSGFVTSLYVQPHLILNPEKPGSNFESLLLLDHELGHARQDASLKQGIPSPYHGSIQSLQGSIIEALGKEPLFDVIKSYESSFQLDEIRQHGADDDFIIEHANSPYFEVDGELPVAGFRVNRNMRVLEFSWNAIQALDRTLTTWNEQPDAIKFSISSGLKSNLPEATITDTTTGIRYTIPIPDAPFNYEHPFSLEHLGKAITTLRATLQLNIVTASSNLFSLGAKITAGRTQGEFIDSLDCSKQVELPAALKERSGLARRYIAFKDALYDIFSNQH